MVHSSKADSSGVLVSPGMLEEVERGVTTEAWLIAALGKPSSRKTVKEDVEILTYGYQQTEHANFTLSLICHLQHDEKHRESVSFELKDGIVQKFWASRE